MNVTNQRIEIVKILKENFGNRFVGGILEDSFSKKAAANLLLPNGSINKWDYMKMLKENYIGICSVGLHNSTPWKFAEYVAASKAIISNPINYEVPGDFSVNKNYLSYSNQEELIERTNFLIDNNDLIYEIEKNNYDYYKEFLRPDKLVLGTLNVFLERLH